MAKILGVEFAPLNVPMKRRLETAAVFQWISCFLFFTFGMWFLAFGLLFTRYWWITCAYSAWFIYDHKVCRRGGRRNDSIRRWRVWKHYRDYFPISLIKTCELDAASNYLFVSHPHGVISCGAFCNFGTEGTEFSSVFPGIRSYLLTLTGLFWFPGFREYFLCTGACDASKESIEHIFTREGKGNAAVLIVGGAKEALEAHPGKHILFLKNRKGFVRIALKYGVDLVPVYSFGETDVFAQVDNPPGSWVRWAQDKMVARLGLSSPLFHGRGIFNYTVGVVPFRRPINTVVGRPIPVEKRDVIDEKVVDELHEEYVRKLVELFDDNKEKYATNKEAKLTIK